MSRRLSLFVVDLVQAGKVERIVKRGGGHDTLAL